MNKKEIKIKTEDEKILTIQMKDGVDGRDGKDGINGKDGKQGLEGKRGEKGDKGDKGEKGDKGIDGKDGKDGKQGPKGDKGEKGEPGKDGKSVSEDLIKKFEKKVQDTESNLLWVNNGAVKSIHAGTNITVTGDPQNPTISAVDAGDITGAGTPGSLTKWTGVKAIGNATADVDYQLPISGGSTHSVVVSVVSDIVSASFTGESDDRYSLTKRDELSLTSNQDNYSTSAKSLLIVTPDASGYNLTGVRSIGGNGILYVVNKSDTFYFNITDQDTNSLPEERFKLPNAATFKLNPLEGAIFIYDDKSTFMWYLLARVSAGGGGGVSSVTGTAPIVVDNTDPANPIITITQSGASADGYLSSTDWNTFNNKLSATLNSAKIFVGNGSNVATAQLLSGDASLSNTGALTIANDAVTFAKMQNINTGKLLGRTTAGSGDTEEITPDTNVFDLSAGALGLKTNASTGEVLYKTATGLDGASSLLIDSNGVPNLKDDPTVATPSNGAIAYTKSTYGKRFLTLRDKLGDGNRLQPHFGDNVVRQWIPTGAGLTTLYALGITIAYTGSTNGITPTNTNYFTTRNRIINTTGGVANSTAVGRHNGLFAVSGDAAGRGGYYWVAEFGREDAALVTDARWWIGLYGTNSAIGASTEPSALTTMLGFGRNSTDTNLQFMNNDSSGTATKTDLGSSFPGNTNKADWYKGEIYCPPNSSTIYYAITNMSTGTVASGSVSSNLPAQTAYLAPQGFINNTATAAAAGLSYGRMYIETYS